MCVPSTPASSCQCISPLPAIRKPRIYPQPLDFDIPPSLACLFVDTDRTAADSPWRKPSKQTKKAKLRLLRIELKQLPDAELCDGLDAADDRSLSPGPESGRGNALVRRSTLARVNGRTVLRSGKTLDAPRA